MEPSYQPDLMTRTEISTTTRVIVALFVLIIVSLITFLNLPLAEAGASVYIVALQTQLLQTTTLLVPYLIVAFLGGTVGIAELSAAFQTFPREALRTRWAKILIGVNAIAAILALGITRLTMPNMHQVLQVVLVGVGFQSLIRTRFVLAKQIGSNGRNGEDISVNIGWLYDQFQNLCRTQIDLELMNNRRTAVTDLIRNYPSLTELYDIAYYTIIARATLSPLEEEHQLQRLERLIEPSAPENFARTSIALSILENGGPGYVNLLLTQAMSSGPEAAMMVTISPERLVAQMMDKYSLDELIKLTDQLTSQEKVQTWVREAAKPDDATSINNRKAAICHMLIQQAGIEAVQGALQNDL